MNDQKHGKGTLEAVGVSLDVSSITLDPTLQTRQKLNTRTVRKYSQAMATGAEFPPVSVALIDGGYLLIDGFHRLAAHRELGRSQVDALVVATSHQETMFKAALVNLTHGQPLNREEKARAFCLYVKAGMHKSRGRFKSFRQIAREMLGAATKNTIQAWMHQYFPHIAAEMGGPPKGINAEDPERVLLDIRRQDHLISLDQTWRQFLGLAKQTAQGDLSPYLGEIEELLKNLQKSGVERLEF